MDCRKKFSRRRMYIEEENVGYINEFNRSFNKKLERAYGAQSVEIRQNLERGTALWGTALFSSAIKKIVRLIVYLEFHLPPSTSPLYLFRFLFKLSPTLLELSKKLRHRECIALCVHPTTCHYKYTNCSELNFWIECLLNVYFNWSL